MCQSSLSPVNFETFARPRPGRRGFECCIEAAAELESARFASLVSSLISSLISSAPRISKFLQNHYQQSPMGYRGVSYLSMVIPFSLSTAITVAYGPSASAKKQRLQMEETHLRT